MTLPKFQLSLESTNFLRPLWTLDESGTKITGPNVQLIFQANGTVVISRESKLTSTNSRW